MKKIKSKTIDEINKLAKEISKTNEVIDQINKINDSIIISGNIIIDKKNFSLMSITSSRFD